MGTRLPSTKQTLPQKRAGLRPCLKYMGKTVWAWQTEYLWISLVRVTPKGYLELFRVYVLVC